MNNGANRQKNLAFAFLILLAAITLWLCFLIARPFLPGIIIATLLAVTIYPLFYVVLRWVPSRSAAALLVILAVLLLLVVSGILVVNAVADEMQSFAKWLGEQRSAGGGWQEVLVRLTGRPLGWIEQKTGISQEHLRSAAVARLSELSALLFNWVKTFAVHIGGALLSLLVVLLTFFYFLRDGPTILARAGSVVPLARDRYDQLLQAISDSMRANFYAVIAVAAAQSLVGAIGYAVAGLPNIGLWIIMTAIFSPIPVAGAGAVWSVGVLYFALTAHWGRALFLLLYGVGCISVVDNVVRSLILGGKAKINALLVFFSLLGGAKAFGVVGLFVGPIVLSVAVALWRIIAEESPRWKDNFEPAETGEHDLNETDPESHLR